MFIFHNDAVEVAVIVHDDAVDAVGNPVQYA